jgi:hypothetical protein
VVPRGDALAAIRNKIIEHVKLLNTQPDLEQTLRDVIKRRSEQLLAELDELESVADDQPIEQRPR